MLIDGNKGTRLSDVYGDGYGTLRDAFVRNFQGSEYGYPLSANEADKLISEFYISGELNKFVPNYSKMVRPAKENGTYVFYRNGGWYADEQKTGNEKSWSDYAKRMRQS